ncbi:unnamed protein product [Rotaria socialis]|uniref:Uncharacterized protein n=1 Tax=Rotaria socialis TaxID=392032 RepID=A0A818UCU5_9BILA|nr:unnamed protein product [Rotaria socialis]CAF4606620.1 unnamed protein product [Rotaria socialis]
MASNFPSGENDSQRYSDIAEELRTSPSHFQDEPEKEVTETQSTVKLSYQQKELTDAKMQLIRNEALIEEQCTELDLSDDEITHEGGLNIEEIIQNNQVTF